MTSPTVQDRSAEFRLIAEIRQLASSIGIGISEKTQKDYLAKYERMKQNSFMPDDAETKQSFYALRAALIWVTAEKCKEALRNRDRSTYLSSDWHDAMAQLETARKTFEFYPPDPERQHRESGSLGITWESIKQEKQKLKWREKSHSKKQGLGTLVKIPDWREKLFLAISPIHRNATAVALLTGARPADIAKGVKISTEGNNLKITIQGSKIGPQRGQPERILFVKIDNSIARHLAALADKEEISFTTNPKALSAAVTKAGKKAFPLLRQNVSPYTLRHALASDLKSSGTAPPAIAEILGHRTTESQSVYGRAAHSSAGHIGIVAVRASLPVRDNRRIPTDLSLKRHTGPRMT